MYSDNHRARKRFGQNFLHDPLIIQRIVDVIKPQKTDHIIEIGPGKGALTKPILNCVARLEAIEIDQDLIVALSENQRHDNRLLIHQADVLKFRFDSLQHNDLRIVGNLPYNISTPVLFHLLTYRDCIKDMMLMLQKEVAERISASSGSKQYGRLSIMLQYYFDVDLMFVIKPEAFTPSPKVDSALVRLTPLHHPRYELLDHDSLKVIVKAAFSQRRKTIRNALKKHIATVTIERIGINAESRAENLNIADFVKLANCYHQLQTNMLSN